MKSLELFSRLGAVLTALMASMLMAGPAAAQSATRMRLLSAPNPSAVGQPVSLRAEVDGLGGGAPTGTVAFSTGATALGGGVLRAEGRGQATLAANCALTSAGGVKCWGSNGSGQLGDGTTTDRLAPVDVVGLSSGVVTIAAGWNHSCALTSAGGVKCWGSNGSGQLGDGTTTQRLAPVDVVGLSSGVVAIATGGAHSCALTRAGGIKCWGKNGAGSLGDGTTTDRLAPVDVVGLSRGVVAIAAGLDHSCALTSTGGVKCWGRNWFGQLGDGTTTQRLAPVDVVGLSRGVVAIAPGGRHSCALTSGGAVKCWGANNFGQLGDGTGNDRPTPVDVVGLSSGVVAIATGGRHSCALTSTGGVKCWGNNSEGQIGDGTTTQRPAPVDVVGLSSGVVAIAPGGGHSCALTRGGAVKCWGANNSGQLGDGRGGINRLTAVPVSGLASGGAAISAGWLHSCALTSGGAAKCWGNNDSGQLGDGTTTQRPAPVDVVGLSSGVVAISGGGDSQLGPFPASVAGLHSCALTAAGGVKCWGDNSDGRLGDGTTTPRLAPIDVVGLSSGVTAIAAGGAHSCALTSAGGVKCWGDNFFKQLGDGTRTDRPTPVDLRGVSGRIAAIAAGGLHSCALTSTGGVKCWGNNSDGQIGDGTTTSVGYARAPLGLTSGVTAIAAGGAHSCALTRAGAVKCWGNNDSGQLGDGTTTQRLAPVDVVGLSSGVVAIAAGGTRSKSLFNYMTPRFHSCALTRAGAVKCWGYKEQGQLGDGVPVVRVTPVATKNLVTLVRSGVRLFTAVLGAGLHTLNAVYSGDAAHTGSSGQTQHRVR